MLKRIYIWIERHLPWLDNTVVEERERRTAQVVHDATAARMRAEKLRREFASYQRTSRRASR